MKRFKVYCYSEGIGEHLLTIRAKNEDTAINKVYSRYTGVTEAKIASDEIVSPDVYKSNLCPYSIMHKRTTRAMGV